MLSHRDKFSPTISREELESLPLVNYDGKTVVVNTRAEADRAVAALRAAGCVIGFDTETRPSFQRGVVYKVALVQLSAGRTCYLFRLCNIRSLDPLRSVLEDPSLVKVGLSTHDDFANLRKWGPLEPRGFIELQHLVAVYGIKDMSLAKIYAILFGQKISKRQRLTNWEAQPLTDRQMAYAALDAAACVEIYERLTRMGRQLLSEE